MISIIIPVYNKWNFTKACLLDLGKLEIEHEIIVVDNASTDETQNAITTFQNGSKVKYQNLQYIRNENNEGFAKACNKGASKAIGDYILFLNNDIRVKFNHSNWPELFIKNGNDKALMGPTMGALDENYYFIKEANKYLENKYSYISGWCICAKKEIWDKLGYFDESFFCYFEDTYLSFYAKYLKIPLHVVDIPLIHFGKISSGNINAGSLYLNGRDNFINKIGKLHI